MSNVHRIVQELEAAHRKYDLAKVNGDTVGMRVALRRVNELTDQYEDACYDAQLEWELEELSRMDDRKEPW